jgi:hypothetical protein
VVNEKPHLRHFLLGGSRSQSFVLSAGTGHPSPTHAYASRSRNHRPKRQKSRRRMGRSQAYCYLRTCRRRTRGALPASSHHALGALPAGEGSRMSARLASPRCTRRPCPQAAATPRGGFQPMKARGWRARLASPRCTRRDRWRRPSGVTRSTVHVGQLRRACLARAKAQPSRLQLHIGCGHGRWGRVNGAEGPAQPPAAPRLFSGGQRRPTQAGRTRGGKGIQNGNAETI